MFSSFAEGLVVQSRLVGCQGDCRWFFGVDTNSPVEEPLGSFLTEELQWDVFLAVPVKEPLVLVSWWGVLRDIGVLYFEQNHRDKAEVIENLMGTRDRLDLLGMGHLLPRSTVLFRFIYPVVFLPDITA